MAAISGPEIEKLIQLLARLPGLGPRSARRAALHLIKKKDQLMGPLAEAMQIAYSNIMICDSCGNADTQNPCMICADIRRDRSILIVVEDISDLWALERVGSMNACYHVLGGVLSPLDGVTPEQLSIDKLVKRAAIPDIQEVILALNATVDGQTTAFYIMDMLAHLTHLKITRLAHGVPVGGELDYLDEGTLAAALKQRTNLL